MYPTYRFRTFVTVGWLAAVLSGCGGGSSSTMPDEDMTTGGGPMTGGGAAEPTAFMSGVDRLYGFDRTEAITDDGDTEVIEDDSETPSGWHLTVDGRDVEFAGSDYGAVLSYPDRYVTLSNDGEEAWFWSEEEGGFEGDPAPEFDYLNVYGFSHSTRMDGADFSDPSTVEPDHYERGDFIYIVDGTPTSDMPVSGSAMYVGRVEARQWQGDSPGFWSSATRFKGGFSMSAEFAASGAEIMGAFSNLEVALPGSDSFTRIPGGTIPFATSVDGNQLAIGDLSIEEGPFAGYQNIGIRAAFFGPEAAEVGGVFEADNPAANTLLHGWFAGDKQ